MIMLEEWKVVEGWNGKYEVSNTAKVRNTYTGAEVAQVLTGIPQYKYVNLRNKEEHKLVRVHRLVAIAFLPNPDDLPMTDHIDRDKMNNHLSNLRWIDNSGNQRNLDKSVYFGSVHIKEFVDKYDSPEAAYKHILSSIGKGITKEIAVAKYEEYLDYGMCRRKVVWDGEEFYLVDLCIKYSVDYETIRCRLGQGWDLWNAIYNISSNNPNSFEVQGNLSVGHWFPSKTYFSILHSNSLLKYVDEGLKYEDILSKDGKDYLRQTVRGVYGTIKELCEYFETSEGAVNTNIIKKGMTLEEALFAPRQRVKRMSVNGVYNSPKYWYESFGINAKRANGWKSTNNKTFKETFEHYGVDTSEMIISTV